MLERERARGASERGERPTSPETSAPASLPWAAPSTARPGPLAAERGGGVRGGHLVLEDRAEAGDAGRDPDLAEGVVDARGHAAALSSGTTPIAVEASGGLIRPMPAPGER